jgi:hypothetical protein
MRGLFQKLLRKRDVVCSFLIKQNKLARQKSKRVLKGTIRNLTLLFKTCTRDAADLRLMRQASGEEVKAI